jgi:hypothetical protein
MFPGPVQVTVRGALIEPGTAASSVWCKVKVKVKL